MKRSTKVLILSPAPGQLAMIRHAGGDVAGRVDAAPVHATLAGTGALGIVADPLD